MKYLGEKMETSTPYIFLLRPLVRPLLLQRKPEWSFRHIRSAVYDFVTFGHF